MNFFTQLTGEHYTPDSAKPTKRSMFDGRDPAEKRKKPGPKPRKPRLAAGDKVGDWTLVEYKPGHNGGAGNRTAAQWLCHCSCGVERLVKADNLIAGSSKSCGHIEPNSREQPLTPPPEPCTAYQIVKGMAPLADGRTARKSEERRTMEQLGVGDGFWVETPKAYWAAVNVRKEIEGKKFKITKEHGRTRWQVLRVA